MNRSWFPRTPYVIGHKITCSCMKSSLHIDQVARETIILSYDEECDSNMWEINVNLHVTIHVLTCNGNNNNNAIVVATKLVNLLPRPKIEECRDFVEQQCAICLEELWQNIDGSSAEVVGINCSHVFHERCIFRWLMRCINLKASYTCPLCRDSIIDSTSEGDGGLRHDH
ncbi:hypothetical protein PIB30_070474 [Stylosanthes scabra]|uniref:RING-type domain-containing protein n=1 Tax=Stylosanthes scabra TaxID=79078 RepID=A0ABU6VN46_9FABA|nr:hypothetical protein [Stylosanthes scabra]